MDNYFAVLNGINVKDKAEKKNGLTYLSWAWAWAEVKKLHPDAVYTIYENEQGWNYHTDGRTCWVKTGVTVCGIEHIEYLPVMDHRNNSIPADKVTSFDVNKAIQRSLTKAVARHGLGLYIYAGEDLPEGEEPAEKEHSKTEEPRKPVPSRAKPTLPPKCECCGEEVQSTMVDGKQYTANTIAARAISKYGMALCFPCLTEFNQKAEAEQENGQPG
jgi:hypothetical protein